MAEKHTCCAEVWRGTEWRPRQEACGCKASVERDGDWYCKRHDPVAMAEKRAEKQRISDAEWDAKQKRWRLESAAPDMLAALKAILPMAENGAAKPGHGGFCGPEQSCDCECMYAAYDSERLYNARAAIRKAEGES